MLYCRGLLITATSLSISSLLSSPALRHETKRKSRAPLADIHLSLFAHGSGETATNTLDGGQGIDDLLFAIDVGVEDTQNVLELSLVDETLRKE